MSGKLAAQVVAARATGQQPQDVNSILLGTPVPHRIVQVAQSRVLKLPLGAKGHGANAFDVVVVVVVVVGGGNGRDAAAAAAAAVAVKKGAVKLLSREDLATQLENVQA